MNFLRVVGFIVKLHLPWLPLSVPPALSAHGLAVVALSAGDQRKRGFLNFLFWIRQQRPETLASQSVRCADAAVVGDGGVQVDQFDD